MAYQEYDDLYIKAQTNGNFKLFVFDIENSKLMTKEERKEAQFLSNCLLDRIYKNLIGLELELHKEILHTSNMFNEKNTRGDLQEPFNLMGDSYGFTIIKESLSDDVILNIMRFEKEGLDIPFNYHISSAYYETDQYGEGDKEYFRGYCIQKLALEKNKRLIKI